MKTSTWHGMKLETDTGGKSGAILGMALVIVLALSLLGLGLLNLGGMNAVEVSRNYNLNKAFWAAEAGLYHVRARLLVDDGYRNQVLSSPTVFANSTPELSYTGLVMYITSSNSFSIVSTGTVQNATRIVAQSVMVITDDSLPNAFDYAIFGGTNDFSLKKNSIFNGPVFVNGEISYKTPLTFNTNYAMYETITGVVDVVVGNGLIPDPAPIAPVLDTSDYDVLINNTSGKPALSSNVFLSGTQYYGGNVKFPPAGFTETSGEGTGTMVFEGDVTIENGAMLTNKLRIIAGGNVDISANLGPQTTVFIYSDGNVNFSKDVTVNNATIIANGNITAQKTLTLTGVLYANGGIDFKMRSTITGSVVAAEGFAVGNSKTEKDFNVTWNTNDFKFMDVLTNGNTFVPPPPQIHANPDWRQIF